MSNTEKDSGTARETWETPVIKSIVPIDHTRGGAGNKNDQDDVFYKTS